MPGVSTISFEVHPFTIASVDTARDETGIDVNPMTEKDSLDETVERVFHRRLRWLHCEVAEKGGKAKVLVVNGPYGESLDTTDHNTSMFIASGSSIPFTLPLLLDGIK